MSKRLTSFLLGALAVVLLGAPAQAQDVKAVGPANSGITAIRSIQKPGHHSFADMVASEAFRNLDTQQQTLLMAAVEKNEKKDYVTPLGKGWTLNLHQQGNATGRQFSAARNAMPQNAVNSRGRLTGATTDANGIITDVDGEVKVYTRSGIAYFLQSQQVYYDNQSGNVMIVEDEDGTVYVKDIISRYNTGAWVKGTKNGNTISIPVGQPVNYNSNYDATLSVYWATYDSENGFAKSADAEILFTVDGDVITLQGSNEDKFIGVFWDDDDSFTGYGDYETVWTYQGAYEPASTDPIVAPAGLVTETWFVSGQDYSSESLVPFNRTANVGFDGNDIYIQGLCADFPDSWIKGTIDGTTVTFSKFQFQGVYYDTYNIWFTGYNGELSDCIMNYDAEAKKLTLDENNYLVFNAADDRLYYLELILSLTISATYEEPTAETGDPIETLPYTNTFDTDEEMAVFGVLDANSDSKTWSFVYDESAANGYAFYSYHSTNEADDWLITPAVYLEAGKAYHFGIDVKGRSYPERFEVLLGTAPKVSAFTQQVIAPTDVDWTDFVTFDNEAVTVEESGYYHFGIHAISDPDEFQLIVDNLVIEMGADPAAPNVVTDLVVESFQSNEIGVNISFVAPATAISGEPLTENLTKIELKRDGNVVKTWENVAPGTKINYADQDEDLTLGTHKYQVIPYNAAGAGKKSDIIEVFASCLLSVPYTFDLTQENVFVLFETIDVNGDGKTWAWNSSVGTYNTYTSTGAGDCDDYLISMPFQLKAGQNYNIVLNARAYSASYPQAFEVLVMKEDGEVVATAIPATEIQTTAAADYEGEFTVPADGIYKVAIHDISGEYMYYLIVSSLTVENGLLPTAPVAPILASVVPDPLGANKAVITVQAPAKNVSGDNLTSNIDKLNIYRDGQIVKTFENVRPGDTKVYVDFVDAAGQYSYQAIPYDNEGNRGAKSDVLAGFIGLDVPTMVENFQAFETEDGVLLKWDPVTEGAYGGVIVPSDVTYAVCTGTIEYMWGIFPVLTLDEPLFTTTETAAYVPYDQSGVQEFQNLYIIASNEAGRLEDDYAAAIGFFTGEAYTMPFEEHFAQNNLNYDWYIHSYTDYSDFDLVEDGSDEDGFALAAVASAGDESVVFTPGKVKVANGNPVLIIDVKGDGSRKNYFRVMVQTPDFKVTTLAVIKPTAEYKTYKISLADFANDAFIKPLFGCDFNEAGQINMDHVRMCDLLEYNLAASIDAPKSIKAGETAKINVTVANIGEKAAEGFTVKLFAGDDQLLSEKVTEPLASFAKKTFTADFATTIFDDADDIVLSTEIIYELDLDDEDNVAETVISVKQSSAAAPENVVAEKTGEGVKLSWTAPANSTEQVTENFDDTDVFEPFSLGGISAESANGAFGDWTLYDGARSTVYGFNGIEFPNAYQVSAWQVWNAAQIGQTENYGAASGDQCLISWCPVLEDGSTPAADHWLISPSLPGVAQTISFKARALTDQYGEETFQVLYSTTTNDPASFTLCANISTAATEWTDFTCDLPEGATYFAIRHTSTDVFGLLIDDITYTRGGGSIAGYNVYVDCELYETTAETSIELKGVSTSSTFAVSAVYANGTESRPVVVTISSANQEITAIEQIMRNGNPVDIYGLDGRMVRQQATSLEGLKGAYIINGRTVIVK